MAQTADSTTTLNPHTCLRACVAYMAAETGDGCQEGEGDLVDLWHDSSGRERTHIVDAARERLAERERGVLEAVKHLEEEIALWPDGELSKGVIMALVALGYKCNLSTRKVIPLEGGET